MLKIVAIGGGQIAAGETDSINKEIVRLSGKKRPKLLFIPTASHDAPGYVETVKKKFSKLGCRVDALLLYSNPENARKKILDSDIVYVGGGNTLRMMKFWRKLGVDKALLDAGRKGTVLSGLSAGALCWFRIGNSDSRRYSGNSAELIKVRGLDCIPCLACPHYDKEKNRKQGLRKMMRTTSGVALALDNCAALEIVGDRYRILGRGNAHKVYWKRGRFFHEKLQKNRWAAIEELTSS